ncbi:MAG: hypothetical protein ACYS8K_09700, partial [Planctomycetota bacterium]
MPPRYPNEDSDDEVGIAAPEAPRVPPPEVVGQDFNRKRRTRHYTPGALLGEAAQKVPWGEVGEAIVSAIPPYVKPSTYRAAPTGEEKAAQSAAEQAKATRAATTQAPGEQRGERTPTTPTSTGGGGPTTAPTAPGEPDEARGPQVPKDLGPFDRVVKLPGEAGYAVVHEGPDGVGPPAPDPATRPGGFAHPGARRERSFWEEEEERIAALPERGETTRGPKRVSPGGVELGGHEWTLRRPGRQEAAYEAARYRRGVQARQAAEDAAISELDARAAAAAASLSRSRALEEQPFAPEMAEVAGRVGAARAEAQPEMARQSAAQEAFMRFQMRAAQIDADPNLTPEQKAQARRQAEMEAWMSIIAVQP